MYRFSKRPNTMRAFRRKPRFVYIPKPKKDEDREGSSTETSTNRDSETGDETNAF